MLVVVVGDCCVAESGGAADVDAAVLGAAGKSDFAVVVAVAPAVFSATAGVEVCTFESSGLPAVNEIITIATTTAPKAAAAQAHGEPVQDCLRRVRSVVVARFVPSVVGGPNSASMF